MTGQSLKYEGEFHKESDGPGFESAAGSCGSKGDPTVSVACYGFVLVIQTRVTRVPGRQHKRRAKVAVTC